MAPFIDIEVQFKELQARRDRGELSQSAFLQAAAELMCQDKAGRWWTIHPETGMWHYRWQNEWRPGVPPGHTPSGLKEHVAAAPTSSPSSPAEETIVAQAPSETVPKRSPRWLLAPLAAIVLVAAVIVLLFVVILPRLELPAETTPAETPRLVATFTPLPPTPTRLQATATLSPSSTPTPTPAPTESALAAVRPAWPQALSDDFSDPDSGWSRGMGEGTLVDYQDGCLRVVLQGQGLRAWSRYELQSFGNGWVEVTVAELASAAGIAVHVSEDYGGYVFSIDDRGRYAVGKTLPEAEPPLVDWTPSTAINTGGQQNVLGVLIENGTSYRFFINGQLVERVEDETYPFGMVALWGASGDGAGASISFDDLLLLLAPAGPSQTPLPKGSASPTAASATMTPIRQGTEAPASADWPPLDFQVHYDAWYPGSGTEWIIRFRISAEGGDGNYRYLVSETVFDDHVFDLRHGCGFPFVGDISVESGDGQRVSRPQYIRAVACAAP